MPAKKFTFTFATGATGTNKQQVGVANSVLLVVSNITSWNAGNGNVVFTIRGGLSETATHSDILPSMTVSTQPASGNGVYVMPYQAMPFMSVGFGTAVTGANTSPNNIDVIVYSDDL